MLSHVNFLIQFCLTPSIADILLLVFHWTYLIIPKKHGTWKPEKRWKATANSFWNHPKYPVIISGNFSIGKR